MAPRFRPGQIVVVIDEGDEIELPEDRIEGDFGVVIEVVREIGDGLYEYIVRFGAPSPGYFPCTDEQLEAK